MSNMSYCRFQITLHDLLDCQQNLDDDDVDNSENTARIALIELCKEIANKFAEIDDLENYFADKVCDDEDEEDEEQE